MKIALFAMIRFRASLPARDVIIRTLLITAIATISPALPATPHVCLEVVRFAIPPTRLIQPVLFATIPSRIYLTAPIAILQFR